MPVHYDTTTIDRGDTRTLTVQITSSGELVDPDTLTLTIRTPAGAATTYTYGVDAIARDSEGVYHFDVLFTQTGTWRYQWESTNPTQVQGDVLEVQPSPLDQQTPGLTLAGLKARLGHELNAADPELQDYLDAALAQAQAPWPHGCGRLLIPNPVSDLEAEVELTFQMTGHRLRVPDARILSAVEVDGVSAAYRTMVHKDHIVAIAVARAAPVYETPVLPAQRTVTLTGRFGFAVLPANLLEAIYLLAARYHYEKAAQYADQVAILEGTAVQSYYRQLPPRAKLAFAEYMVASYAGTSLA